MGVVKRYRRMVPTLFCIMALSLCLQAAYGTSVFTVDQLVSMKSRSWTYSVKETGDLGGKTSRHGWLAIDPIRFEGDGVIVKMTWTPQQIRLRVATLMEDMYAH